MKIVGRKLSNEFIVALTPLVFTYITVFHTRTSVGTFYLLAVLLIIFELYMIKKVLRFNFKKTYPYILIVAGSIGLAAAGILTIEKIELLKDPNRITSCSISPVVACSPIINSPEASIFTIPNPAFGILGFGLVISVGMVLLAGATKLKAWWWQVFLAGTATGTAFCAWLIYVTLYEVGSICVYCSGAWAVTVAIFIATLKFVSEEGAIKLPAKLKRLVERYPIEVIATLYGIVIALILQRFWDYWVSLI